MPAASAVRTSTSVAWAWKNTFCQNSVRSVPPADASTTYWPGARCIRYCPSEVVHACAQHPPLAGKSRTRAFVSGGSVGSLVPSASRSRNTCPATSRPRATTRWISDTSPALVSIASPRSKTLWSCQRSLTNGSADEHDSTVTSYTPGRSPTMVYTPLTSVPVPWPGYDSNELV